MNTKCWDEKKLSFKYIPLWQCGEKGQFFLPHIVGLADFKKKTTLSTWAADLLPATLIKFYSLTSLTKRNIFIGEKCHARSTEPPKLSYHFHPSLRSDQLSPQLVLVEKKV